MIRSVASASAKNKSRHSDLAQGCTGDFRAMHLADRLGKLCIRMTQNWLGMAQASCGCIWVNLGKFAGSTCSTTEEYGRIYNDVHLLHGPTMLPWPISQGANILILKPPAACLASALVDMRCIIWFVSKGITQKTFAVLGVLPGAAIIPAVAYG